LAIFRMQISYISRAAGRRATAAAAYRSGERIRDERTGELFNHARRRDILHTEIFLPSQFDGTSLQWARNRERLWNTAEHAEKRHNSRLAREYQVILPAELDAPRRVALARAFAREIAERYKVAVDLAVHEPRPDADPRNFHAHLLPRLAR
jgi:ATP-dependent exoDNAse (exonuclease V) alpha subunit